MTITTSSGHQKLLVEAGAPVNSGQLDEWVAWTFAWSPEGAAKHLGTVAARLAEIDHRERHVITSLVRADLIASLRNLGLPCDPDKHDAPVQFLNLCPISRSCSSIDEYMNDPADDERPMEILTPVLLPLWSIKFRELSQENLAATKTTEDALEVTLDDLHMVTIRLLLLTWPKYVKSHLWALDFYSKYFRYARGCFDLESGCLVNRELPALREYIDTYGGSK